MKYRVCTNTKECELQRKSKRTEKISTEKNERITVLKKKENGIG